MITHSERKKILYVITKSNWGGAQKYVFDMATSLPKDLFDVAVVFGGNGPLAEKLKEAGIRTICVESLQRDISLWNDIRSSYNLFSIFKKERPDIVHVNSSKVGGLGALVSRTLRVPRIVFTCHGWPFNEERGFLSLWSIRILSWLTVVFSHITITVSARDEIDGKKMPWVKNKIRLVHNGIHEPEFKSSEEAFLTMSQMAHDKGVEISAQDFLIGCIGELHNNKGYPYLLEGFSKLSGDDNKLVIMGEGEEREKLEKLIKEYRLENRVALVGFVAHAPTYLKAFKAFTLTSIKEGLPYVVIEAGFAELPVVATNVGGVKEIIEDMKTGILVQTRKPEDIAQGLQMLRDEPSKAKTFAKDLRDRTIVEFSISTMVKNTVSIYKE